MDMQPGATSRGGTVGAGHQARQHGVGGGHAHSPREFTYKEVRAATRGFDASRVIGNGAFGVVCKGILSHAPR